MDNEESRYDDIINLPHKQSSTRTHMSGHDRAAQFAPFAALVGYDDAVRETARLTDERVLLSDEQKSGIDMKLQLLSEHLCEQPEISITYFVPDAKKSGGEYVTKTGIADRIDEYERTVVFKDKKKILVSDILDINGELFGLFDSGNA